MISAIEACLGVCGVFLVVLVVRVIRVECAERVLWFSDQSEVASK